MRDLVIVGAGGLGRETVALIRDINQHNPEWNFIGFIDEKESGHTVEGYKILGDLEFLLSMPEKPDVAIAIASAKVRKRIVSVLKEKGFQFPSLIHPSVSIGPGVSFGEGCIICRGGMYTTNIQMGNFCISNLNCTYGHDTQVGNFVSIMSHTAIAGDVYVGDGCYFGLHCTVINLTKIAENCTFGAGSVVVRDIAETGTYVGVPAKRIK